MIVAREASQERNIMRKLNQSLLALMLAGLTCAASSAVAQDTSGTPQAAPPADTQPEHGGRRHFDPAQRTEMLTKHLKLTADQQPKVLDILKSEQSQMESLRSDASTSRDDRRSKMMDIHKASDDQIRALLDSDQQKKFDEMQAKRERWQGRRGGSTPPPPDADQK
jgi:Spy/CpxP family protein refolding chaperone